MDHVRDLECFLSKNHLIIISGLETRCWSYARSFAVDGDRIEPDLHSLEQQTITFEAKCKASHNHTLCEQETKRTALFKLRLKLEGTDVNLHEQRSVHTARQGRTFRQQHEYEIGNYSKKTEWMLGGQFTIKELDQTSVFNSVISRTHQKSTSLMYTSSCRSSNSKRFVTHPLKEFFNG